MKYMTRHLTVWTMTVFIFLTLIPPPCHAARALDPGTAKIVSGIEATYANKSFSSDFEQTSRLTALDVTETARGKAWFSHPGKMKWAYHHNGSDTHEIITNGKDLWIYRPRQNQVMTAQAASFFQSGSGGAFLADIGKIRAEFTIEPGKLTEAVAQLVLTPKKRIPELAKIRITVNLPGYEIPVVETENVYGDTTRFIFTNIRFSKIDTQMFEFTPPTGAEIIEME